MKKMLFTKLILLCASLLFFASCSNLIDSAERAALEGEKTSASEQSAGKKVSFTGSVCVAGALPECFRQTELASPSHNSTSRSALPSFTIGTNYFYYVIASQKDGNGSVRINSIDNAEAFSLSSGVTFDLELSFGSWEIKCGICDRFSPDFLLSDTYQFTISDTNPSINHTFYPKPSQKGSGTVALQISYESGKVDSITAKCGNNSWSVTTSETQATIEKSSINSGAYDLSIYFFKNDDQGNPLPVYATNQTINVFDNMTTNTWVSDGSGLIDGSGVFTLTSELINQFARTTFYVGQTTAATNIEFTASDSDGSGSPYKPLKTLKKAIEIIKLLNAESSEYRVFVCEDQNLSGLTESLSLVPEDKAINLTIQGFDPQNSERQFILSGYNESSQKSQFDGAFIKIAGKSKTDTIVTLRNLSIYGHINTLSSASNGGGLLCSQAKVLLENVDIRDNECGEKGAGIFATSSSIVTIKDSYIEGNIVTDLDKAFGAGIALMAGATVYIEGNTHILENKSAKDGGGIGVSETGNNKLYINDGHIYGNTAVNGGGVYNGKELYFSAGGISQNIATALGGGVYSTGSMFMYGSAVIGDSAKTTAATESDCSNKAACGGGIYSTGNLYLGYSSWTSESSNTPQELTGGVFYNFSHDTGGIYQYANKTFLMNSGFVSYNAGRGIYVGNCSFTMSGGSVSGNTTFEPDDNNYQTNGAGIYAGVASTVLISGGTISGNEAGKDGGGLYIAKPETSVTISGGTISSNSAGGNGNGNGIAVMNGSLKMQGGAKVDSSNDVYLASEKYIEITDALSGTAPVTKVTLADFSRGKTVIKADGTNVTDLTPYKNYFTYTQDGWGSKVSADKKSISIDMPIYVAGQTNHPYCGVAGNDTNGNGTKAKPFATIAKAIELLTDKDTDYTIYIDGTVTGGQTIPVTLKKSDSGTYKAQSVTIEGVNGLNNGEPKDSLNGTSGNSVTRPLNIKSEVPVTITNLMITGGNIGGNGGGIYIDTGTNVLLGDGVLVTGNTAASGGGIYNRGKLFLYGSAMVGKTSGSVADASSYGNKATGQGAGIYLDSAGSLYLGYTSWTSDSVKTPAELTGGVCENYLANTDNASAQGGGIYNNGSIYFASGNVSYNYALNGAGIYTQESVTMSGGTIEGNEGSSSNSSGNGGGVYVTGNDKTFTMSGDAVIKNNKNMAHGAGVYLNYQNCKLIVTGNASISGNVAETNGGAVYMHDYNATSYARIEIAGDANIPYGGAAKNNDIFMLDVNAKVKITQSLSNRDADKVIGLTPNSYSVGRTLLEAGSGVTLANEVGKFTVSQANYYIDSSGKLLYGYNVTDAATYIQNLSSGQSETVTIVGDIDESGFAALKSAFDDLFDKDSTNRPRITLDISNCNIDSIPDYAFDSSRCLKEVVLPDTLKSIGVSAFNDSTDLETIELPDGLISIGNYAFNACSNENLTAIQIPASVNNIGKRAFTNIYYLESLIFASGSQLTSVGEGAFADNANLKSIELPSGVTSIPEKLFAGDEKLASITINGTLTDIGKYAFGGLSESIEITYNGGNAEQFKTISKNGKEWRAYAPYPWSDPTYMADSTLINCTGGTSCTAAEADHD